MEEGGQVSIYWPPQALRLVQKGFGAGEREGGRVIRIWLGVLFNWRGKGRYLFAGRLRLFAWCNKGFWAGEEEGREEERGGALCRLLLLRNP